MKTEKKKAALSVNPLTKEIVMSRGFAKNLNIESEEYKMLCDARDRFPDYKIVLCKFTKPEGKESYKGLTYAYMDEYVSKHGTSEDVTEYAELRELARCHSIRFAAIKKWFLIKFPKVKNYPNLPNVA